MIDCGIVGLNYKSCPLYLRERLTKAFERIFARYSANLEGSYVLLSTCNRVELYFSSRDIVGSHSEILSLLRKEEKGVFEHALYSFFGRDMFLHLVRVAAGLDSALIGESDIQRQVRANYNQACTYQSLSSCLHYVFQKALKLSKQVRSGHDYAKRCWALEEVIFSQMKTWLKETAGKKILFIGNSDLNRKILAQCAMRPFAHLALCSRRGKDNQLLEKYPLLQMEDETSLSMWMDYDVIISATKVDHYVIKAMKRCYKRVLVFDLSIPRSVDPMLSKDPMVTLVNIEDLMVLFEEKKRVYKEEIHLCEKSLERSVERYLTLYSDKLIKKHLYNMGLSHTCRECGLWYMPAVV